MGSAMGAKNLSGVREVERDGRRVIVVDFRYRDGAGRTQRYCRDAEVQTLTAAKAEAQRLRLRAATSGTLVRAAPSPTLSTFAASTAWAQHLATRCRPATRERYNDLLGQGMLAVLGPRRLDEMTPQDFRRFEASLRERGVQARGPLSLLRTLLRTAVAAGALAALPELPTLPPKSRKLPDAPDAGEVTAMLQHATGWVRTAVALSAYAGLRMGEVRALEVRDVDLAGGRLLIRRALSADEVVSPKSGHDRVVPIAPELAAQLRLALRHKLPTARVVLTTSGTTPRRQRVLSALRSLQKRHGLPARSFHSIRHAFCSMLVRAGASVEAVRLLAGHSKLDVTQRYVHATGGDLSAAIATLPSLSRAGKLVANDPPRRAKHAT